MGRTLIRRVIVLVAMLALLLLALAPAALAGHGPAGPCNNNGEPGNSDYAEHFIVPDDFDLVAGSFGGFSICLDTGRLFHQP